MSRVAVFVRRRAGAIALLGAALFAYGPGIGPARALAPQGVSVASPAPGPVVLQAATKTAKKPNPDPDRSRRIAAVFGIIGALGAWWVVGTRADRRPKRIGSGAEENAAAVGAPHRVGGIGRFARPRGNNPRRLS